MIDKKKIEKVLAKHFNMDNIILAYYCGSYLYETADENSDIDLMLITNEKLSLQNVLKSDNSYQYVSIEDIDVFVIDYENAIKIKHFDKSTNLYLRVFSDSSERALECLIYKNERFLSKIDEYVRPYIETNIVEYYDNIIEYFRKLYFVRFPNTIKKREYHLFRFIDNFVHFCNTNKYDLTSEGEYKNTMFAFKKAAEKKDTSFCKIFEKGLAHLEDLVMEYVLSKHNINNKIELLRNRLIRVNNEHNEFNISMIGNSSQTCDLSVPANCHGFGRIHHFKKNISSDWINDFLPAHPAYKKLNKQMEDNINAEVFQCSICNLNCWYCFVPEELRNAKPNMSRWLDTDTLINYYKEEKEKPIVLDLSGGNPELIPEWIVDVMHSLKKSKLDTTTYLWSDDSMSSNSFFKYLNDENISYIKSYKNYGKVCCFKGFDFDSYAFNSRANRELFLVQKILFRKYYNLGLDLYGYITLTIDSLDNVEYKIKSFFDYLQSIHKLLPLRVVPLEIVTFKAMQHRLDSNRIQSIYNQKIVLKIWKDELKKRFSNDLLNLDISEVNIYE